MKLCAFILFSVAALAAIATASAQVQQAQSKDVHLYFVINDKGNKPIVDLKPADLSVTDNNQPVILTDLQLVNGKPEVEPRVTLLFNRPGFDPNQKSSNGVSQQTARQLRDQAAKFLKLIPGSGFQISVMDVWGRLQLQQEFTADRKSITDGVAAAVQPGQIGVAVTANSIEQKLDQALQPGSSASLTPDQIVAGRSISAAIFESANYVNNQQIPSGLAGLLALARAEEQIKGRKAIVYFTYSADLMGAGTDAAMVKDAIQTIVGAANRSGVSIYVVNLDSADSANAQALDAYGNTSTGSSNPGLIQGATSSGSATGTNGNGYNQAKAGQFSSASEFRYLASRNDSVPPLSGTLDALVRGTEGFAFSGDDSFNAPVKQLVGDLTTYFVASYVPSTANDGAFHALVVKPVRQGLKVRAQSGYQAPAPASAANQPAKP